MFQWLQNHIPTKDAFLKLGNVISSERDALIWNLWLHSLLRICSDISENFLILGRGRNWKLQDWITVKILCSDTNSWKPYFIILPFCFCTPVLRIQTKLLAIPSCFYISTVPCTKAARKELEPLANNTVNNNRFLFSKQQCTYIKQGHSIKICNKIIIKNWNTVVNKTYFQIFSFIVFVYVCW